MVAAGRADVASAAQVQVVRVRSRVRRLSPPVPERATVGHRGTVNVAGKEEIIRISTETLINRHISLIPTRTTIGQGESAKGISAGAATSSSIKTQKGVSKKYAHLPPGTIQACYKKAPKGIFYGITKLNK